MRANLPRFWFLVVLGGGACTVPAGPSSPRLEGSTSDAPIPRADAPSRPEPEPEAPLEVDGTAEDSALAIPHDMPPLDTPCATRRDFANGRVESALAFAAAGCSVDADCAQVGRGTGCRGGCPTAVLAMHADAYESLRSSVDERVCSTYRDDGCPYATPRCAGGTPQCIEGTCQLAR